ncbi:unnamed protein product [Acanthoscelides obtectus]|uniref:Uncharacterized protein n=1 Tax=Acanthoscelides obtectus TaxID=200917 RepID=A0A9P0KI70_ACAOB|nr:unnamed protein product [Acanthoscelides obtectus]CAK1680365.1 hypothetical protein AOBTE_LOCUS32597 [Acanthoscelides obtectus]
MPPFKASCIKFCIFLFSMIPLNSVIIDRSNLVALVKLAPLFLFSTSLMIHDIKICKNKKFFQKLKKHQRRR